MCVCVVLIEKHSKLWALHCVHAQENRRHVATSGDASCQWRFQCESDLFMRVSMRMRRKLGREPPAANVVVPGTAARDAKRARPSPLIHNTHLETFPARTRVRCELSGREGNRCEGHQAPVPLIHTACASARRTAFTSRTWMGLKPICYHGDTPKYLTVYNCSLPILFSFLHACYYFGAL